MTQLHRETFEGTAMVKPILSSCQSLLHFNALSGEDYVNVFFKCFLFVNWLSIFLAPSFASSTSILGPLVQITTNNTMNMKRHESKNEYKIKQMI
jgi:hypothetical protein